MIKEFNHWTNNILSAEKLSEKLFIYLPECGLGDKITCFPAFRILKKLNSGKKIILVTEESVIDIWKLNKFIDFVIPQEILTNGLESIFLRKNADEGRICNWTFYEHHQQHVVKSCVKYIAGIEADEKNHDLTYEFELTDSQLDLVERERIKLLNKADGKKIVGIAPANTMFSRMWPVDYWKKLVNLIKDNYYVVSLGGKNDLTISNVDFDARGLYHIPIIPKLLDEFHCLVTVNSGMLHIGSVNQNLWMIHLNTGQYPEEIMLPYRGKNDIYHNRIVLNHSCELKKECFEGHITNQKIDEQYLEYKKQYLRETGKLWPDTQHQILQKFTCWYYCLKNKDKYSCNKQITPETVAEKITSIGGKNINEKVHRLFG